MELSINREQSANTTQRRGMGYFLNSWESPIESHIAQCSVSMTRRLYPKCG